VEKKSNTPSLPRFIALCGHPKSGKSLVQEFLTTNFNVQAVDDGGPLRKISIDYLGLTWDQVHTQEGKAEYIEVLGERWQVREILGELGNRLEAMFFDHGDFIPIDTEEDRDFLASKDGLDEKISAAVKARITAAMAREELAAFTGGTFATGGGGGETTSTISEGPSGMLTADSFREAMSRGASLYGTLRCGSISYVSVFVRHPDPKSLLVPTYGRSLEALYGRSVGKVRQSNGPKPEGIGVPTHLSI
jgi:hypothetical protein